MLVAIAEEEDWGDDGDYLLGYHPKDSSTKEDWNQISVVSEILKSALEWEEKSLDYQKDGKEAEYYLCKDKYDSDEERLECVLRVYHSGKASKISVMSGSDLNLNYATDVMEKWEKWKEIFGSGV